MNSKKKILNIALPAMGENFLQMLMGMVDLLFSGSPGLDCYFRCFRRREYHHDLSSHLLALGAAVASVMSKSLGEKIKQTLPTMRQSH